ncbi:MAG: recombination protein RecR [Candidatus Omnitrophota bacterium]|jgi:recombination protein RecR|nr:MAG: recombination protein RecR [Candidatus Omnitrophota bacterium]
MKQQPAGRDFRPLSIPAVEAVSRQLAKLPGIGPRMAQRLTYALLKREKKEIEQLIHALHSLANDVLRCAVCGNYAQTDPCPVCKGEGRNTKILCVVEQPQDVQAIERTGHYNGLYHILGAALSPIDGVGPEEIGVTKLLQRLNDPIEEVILATNPTMEGDATALYLQEVIKPLHIKVTRIARGLPSGSDLEYADEVTLALAFSSRAEM